MQYITYQDFITKYPYFKTLDPEFHNRLEITTITITGVIESDDYINKVCENRIPNISKLLEIKDYLTDDFIHTVISDNTTYSIKQQKKKYNKKCQKKPRKIKFEQITFKTDINDKVIDKVIDEDSEENEENDKDASLSLKIFASGLFHITGANNISSVFWVFHRLFTLMKHIDYCNLDFKNITDFKIAMVNCKCFFPCVIDKYILYEDLMNDFNKKNITDKILSIQYDPMRHSAIKIKMRKENAINDEDILTLLIFAFGKMLITGGTNYSEITYVYKIFYDYLINNQRCILEFNENIINRTFKDNKISGRIICTEDGDSYIVPYDKMHEELTKHNYEMFNKLIESCDDVDEIIEVQQIINKKRIEHKNKKICNERKTYVKRKNGEARVNKRKKSSFIMTEDMLKEMMDDNEDKEEIMDI